MSLAERTILLTGGAGAVGRDLVRDLSPDVCKLIVLDRDETALADLGSEFPEIVSCSCDLACFDDVAGTIGRLYEDGHVVDVLVNNAGSIHSEPLINPLKRPDSKHDLESWHTTIGNNLHSVFYVTACVAEKMAALRTRGVIINVSSIAAAGNAGQSAYGAAKAAVNALTGTWSKELGPLGIRVAAIAPGFMDTASTRHALADKYIDQWVKQTPIGRLGTTLEMARAIRFIIENGYFNGRVLELDGGLKL